MKKIIAVITAIMTMAAAQAAEFEAGIGKSARTVNLSYSLGATWRTDGGLRWHIGLADLGKQSQTSDATWAVSLDDRYPSGTTAHWSAGRDDVEVYATVSPIVGRFREWDVFADVGAAVYRQTWHQEIVDGTTFKTPRDRYKVTPVLGLGLGRGSYAAELTLQRIAADGDFDDGVFNDRKWTLMLKRRF